MSVLRAYFNEGTSITNDAVIGADGIDSTIRLSILEEFHPAAKAVFADSVIYRGIVSMDKAVEI